MSEPDWLDNLILLAAGVGSLISLAGYAIRAFRWLVYFARPDDDQDSLLPSQLPPEPSHPIPPSHLFYWSPTPDLFLPALVDDSTRNWTPTFDTYKALVALALSERGGMLAVPPAYVDALICWFREAYEAGRLAPNQEPVLRPDGPTWLLVYAYPKL